jgi:hypothetical protein
MSKYAEQIVENGKHAVFHRSYADRPTEKTPTGQPDMDMGELEDSLMAIQTVTLAFLLPMCVIAGMFGMSMNTKSSE